MAMRLEHANIAVRDIEGMIRFLQTAFPEFDVRHTGRGDHGLRWVHIGTDETYIALNEVRDGATGVRSPYSNTPGLNHLAFEVDDAQGLHDRLIAAGYRDSTPPNAHPHRIRKYFHDPEGNDWEFVQYLSDDPLERNDYEHADG